MTLEARRKPVHIEREQRKALFEMLREARQYRESVIPKIPVPTPVLRARRIIKEFDALQWTRERRKREAIERQAKLVRELILFGSDAQAALSAVKLFRRGRV